MGTNPHRLILRVAFATLPAHLQECYAEQWQADLEGSQELEISRWSVAWGALVSSASLAANFEFTPLTRAATVARRARLGFSAIFPIFTQFYLTSHLPA